MTDQIVRLGPEYFPRATSGVPISGGSIYIGDPDTDPEIPANQITVNALQENGSTVPISQPILTSGGGVPLYNGSPVTLLVSESYSLKVLDAFDVQVYYVPSIDVPADPVTSSSVDYVADLIGLINVSSPVDDQTHIVLSFYDGLNQGGDSFYWNSTIDKATANGGTIVDPDNIGGFDGTTGTLSTFLAAQGNGVGFGCWVRMFEGTIDSRCFGAVSGTVTDQTIPINTALAAVSDVTMYDGDYYISPDNHSAIGLVLHTDQKLRMVNARLVANPTSTSGYALISVEGVDDVLITGADIMGERDTHIGSTGEWGFGISIRGSNRVRVEDSNIIDCWGDGIYIGSGVVNLEQCSNVEIDRCTVSNNRRNNLSITASNGARISRSTFFNANGTLPESGIDLEPNTGFTVSDTIIDECTSYGNNEEGLLVFNVSGQVYETTVTNSTFRDNGAQGLQITGVNWILSKLRIFDNEQEGIWAQVCDGLQGSLLDIKRNCSNPIATTGDIYVQGSTEVSFDNCSILTDPLTLKAGCFHTLNSYDIRLSNFSIDGQDGTVDSSGMYLKGTNLNITIDNVVIKNVGGHGITTEGEIGMFRVVNCTIENIARAALNARNYIQLTCDFAIVSATIMRTTAGNTPLYAARLFGDNNIITSCYMQGWQGGIAIKEETGSTGLIAANNYESAT